MHSERLRLVATTLAHLEAELQDPPVLAALLGVRIPEGWPPGEYDRHAMAYFHARLSADPGQVGWYGWYAITLSQPATLIAGAGYLGPPKAGTVEIGYSVVPSARGKGYATEIVQALVANAFADPAVTAVIAHTDDLNPASTRVLLRCGFRRIGPGAEGNILYRRAASGTEQAPWRLLDWASRVDTI